MTRTHNQQMADSHEQDIAEWIGGAQQKASGSQWHAQGDAKNGEYLTPFPVTGDGKATLGKSIAVSRDMWKKIIEQTFNQDSALFLRFYQDESLRKIDVDLAVVDVRFFRELLEAARNWENHRVLVQTIENKRIELEMYSPLPSLDQVREAMKQPGGCDCCR